MNDPTADVRTAKLRHREQLTPKSYANAALQVAREYWIELTRKMIAESPPNVNWGVIANAEGVFEGAIFDEAWSDPETNGDISVSRIGYMRDGTLDPDTEYSELQVMQVIVDFSVQAMKSDDDYKRDLAWQYAAEALYWAGILTAEVSNKKRVINPASELAKKRHAENYALIDEAVKYCVQR